MHHAAVTDRNKTTRSQPVLTPTWGNPKAKVDLKRAHQNPNSTFVSDSGFFVSKRSTFLLKNFQP